MLEQKDFINVELKYKKLLNTLKSQLIKGKIVADHAHCRARIELLELKHKVPILKIMLSDEEFQKINELMKAYEDFIDYTTTSLTFNI